MVKNVCCLLFLTDSNWFTLSSLIKKHAPLLFSRKKKLNLLAYLGVFYRQATPNFAYSFITFEEKFKPTHLLES
jgi:hypothetical protein